MIRIISGTFLDFHISPHGTTQTAMALMFVWGPREQGKRMTVEECLEHRSLFAARVCCKFSFAFLYCALFYFCSHFYFVLPWPEFTKYWSMAQALRALTAVPGDLGSKEHPHDSSYLSVTQVLGYPTPMTKTSIYIEIK